MKGNPKAQTFNLAQWQNHIARIHSKDIELGLARIEAVAQRWKKFHCPVILVAGTNGKGTTAFALESIYRASGYKTGLFTSPFLFRYEEQIRILGEAVEAGRLCQAFSEVETRRDDVLLTPFEYLTLAALYCFHAQPLDIVILEVGLGGRLDAVNIVEPDISIITNISLDHQAYLGDTREKIAMEKGGILRPGKPFVFSSKDLPNALQTMAQEKNVPSFLLGRQFDYQKNQDGTWHWAWGKKEIHLPKTYLHLDNLAGVLMAIELLQKRIPVSVECIQTGMQSIHIPGRIQIMPGEPSHILDVSHNPASVAWLAQCIFPMKNQGKMRAVFSMLSDKDIHASIASIQNQIDEWYVAPIQENARACSMETLQEVFSTILTTQYFENLKMAYQAARSQSQADDVIVIFGSFHTVSEVVEGGLVFQ